MTDGHGAESGAWTLESAALKDDHGGELVLVKHSAWSGIYVPRDDLLDLIAALMTYLEIRKLESTD